jgi:MoaA/NifB/PqqE/SkfB family radical SAM enzyme
MNLFTHSSGRPEYVNLLAPPECTLKCVNCGITGDEQGEHLPPQKLIKAVDEVADWLGPVSLAVPGIGEPFLDEGLLEALAHACGRGLQVDVATTGCGFPKERIGRLISLGLNSVSMPLHGVKPETHDFLVGAAGAQEKTLDALRYVIKKRVSGKPRLTVSCMATSRNLREIPDLVRLCLETGVDSVFLEPLWLGGAHSKTEDITNHPLWIRGDMLEELDALLEGTRYSEKDAILEYYRSPASFLDKKPKESSSKKIYISFNGDVKLCPNGDTIGSIQSGTVKDLWCCAKARSARKAITSCKGFIGNIHCFLCKSSI